MPLRLSELLERIRPAGTPGAPGQGSRLQRDHDEEIVGILQVLAGFDTDARSIVAGAQQAAGQQADRSAQSIAQLRDALLERIAATEARPSRHRDPVINPHTLTPIPLETSAALVPLVGNAIDRVWSLVEPTP